MRGLTTNQGFNALGLLAAIFEFGGQYVPPSRHEAFAYVCTGALILICWLTKGSHPADGVRVMQRESPQSVADESRAGHGPVFASDLSKDDLAELQAELERHSE